MGENVVNRGLRGADTWIVAPVVVAILLEWFGGCNRALVLQLLER